MIPDVWAEVVGQPAAVAQLRAAVPNPVHAYLLVGARGVGKLACARAFAGELIAAVGSSADRGRHLRLAAAGQHPDMVVVVPEGRTLRRAEAETIITEASRSPVEGARKVIVVDRFHTAEPEAAASLLKTIEEPPATAVFVLLAEEVPPEHVTIASRCVRVDLPPVPAAAIEEHLVELGCGPGEAVEIAAAVAGNVDRARLLAADERFAARRHAWHRVPEELDGTGAAVARQVAGLRAMIDDAAEPLAARHAAALAEMAEWEEHFGTRGSGRREVEERHRREARLLRDDELRFGLATLAARYRDRAVIAEDPDPYLAAVVRINRTAEALVRNPNEALLLEALFVDLPPLG